MRVINYAKTHRRAEVKLSILSNHPLVSVVIPTHNRKEELIRLLQSIRKGSYPESKTEVIVVSDSSDGSNEAVLLDFPDVRLIRSKAASVSQARNEGMKAAKGELIFLVDDDNVVDGSCISELVSSFSSHEKAGIIGPLMYYFHQPTKVWCGGVDRSMTTSLTKFIGRDEIDRGQFRKDTPSKDFPNAFMLRKAVLEKAGCFNVALFPQHYEESDLAERVRRAGFEVLCHPAAKVWHDISAPEGRRDSLRSIHIHSERRAYYAGRNRVVFFRLYSKPLQLIPFLFVFNWLITIYYLSVILSEKERPSSERKGIARSLVSGVFDGLKLRLPSGASASCRPA